MTKPMENRKLGDLNDHLFAQLERLSGDRMSDADLDREVRRSQAIVSLSDQIVGNANLRIRAAKLYAEHGPDVLPHLPAVGGKNNDEEA